MLNFIWPKTWISWTNDADFDGTEALDIYSWNQDSLSWVIVWVIDDWVAYNHPDLINNMWSSSDCKDENWDGIWPCSNWFDYWSNDNDPAPIGSHWTHVAWIVASEINNSKWTVWLAPHSKVIALKTRFSTLELIKSIAFAKNNWAKIINASWWYWVNGANCGVLQQDIAMYQSIESFSWVFVVAAWNDNENHDLANYFRFPTDFAFQTTCWDKLDNIIVIWATDQNDNKSSFSDYWNVHVWAPWSNIYSTQFSSTTEFTEYFSIYNGTEITWYTGS